MANAASATAVDSALYEVAYDEASRARSEQLVLVDSFRARAGLLLSAATIITSFLGAQALGSGSWGWSSWLALGSFVGVASLSLAILWPRAYELSARPEQIIKDCIETDEPPRVQDLHRNLTLQMQQGYAEIWEDLGRLAMLFQIASGLLAVEAIFWIPAIASTV